MKKLVPGEFLITLVLFGPAFTFAGRWFKFRSLRNAGLVTSNAISSDACVNSCMQTKGCSAVSYQLSSGVCLTSLCNNLDLYAVTGWNAYILGWGSAHVEGLTVPAPQFEWMLTDTCGNTNQGVSNGPKTNLFSVTYAPSQSASAGNAPVFAGNSASYGITDSDSRLNNPMGQNSLSVSMWINWNSVSSTTLHEYSVENTNRGILFWLYSGGLYYDITTGTGTNCSSFCGGTVYAFTPMTNVWYHIAFVYDGGAGLFKVYVNMSLIAVNTVGIVNNGYVWTRSRFAFSNFDPRGPLNGKLYCYKLHNLALTADQLAATAQSCYVGKIRLS